MILYQRLRDLREDSDMTQKHVADLINVSMNHYGKYERGETDLPFEKAIILANYYHVSLDYLAGRTNIKSTFAAMPKQPSFFLKLFQQLNTINQNRIEERMMEMLEQQNTK